jgi:hypothetical protein
MYVLYVFLQSPFLKQGLYYYTNFDRHYSIMKNSASLIGLFHPESPTPIIVIELFFCDLIKKRFKDATSQNKGKFTRKIRLCSSTK